MQENFQAVDDIIKMDFPSFQQVSTKYIETMLQEEYQSKSFWHYPDAAEMYNTALQIFETARLSIIPREFCYRFSDYPLSISAESLNGHILLTQYIVSRALDYQYWSHFTYTEKEGYSLYEIQLAILMYFHPKSRFGDSSTPEDTGEDKWREYTNAYLDLSPNRNRTINYRVRRLITEIINRSSRTGKLIYVAEQVATIIALLTDDHNAISYVISPDNPDISKQEREEMVLCDYNKDGSYYASELYSLEYFKRSKVDFDENGFCTALLVMCSLLVNNGQWYSWRENIYH